MARHGNFTNLLTHYHGAYHSFVSDLLHDIFATSKSSIAPASSTGSVDPAKFKLDAIHEMLVWWLVRLPLAQAILFVSNMRLLLAKASGVCFQHPEGQECKFSRNKQNTKFAALAIRNF